MPRGRASVDGEKCVLRDGKSARDNSDGSVEFETQEKKVFTFVLEVGSLKGGGEVKIGK